jgi:hypothetical protein
MHQGADEVLKRTILIVAKSHSHKLFTTHLAKNSFFNMDSGRGFPAAIAI